MLQVLKANAEEAGVREIVELVEDVMAALRDPNLYAEVLAEAWTRAIVKDVGGVNGALLEMASETGLTTKVVGKSKGVLKGTDFFDKFASKPVHIIDTPLASPDPHGALTHLVQDLVVIRALGKRGANFRALLGQAQKTVKLPWAVARGESKIVRIGDYVWRTTYDLQANRQLPTPEFIGPVLKTLLNIR